MRRTLLFTCEHGGNQIPAQYRKQFGGAADVLKSHRGWDPGALLLAKEFAHAHDVELHYSETSRLLVELNRSLHHRSLFSQFTRDLPRTEKDNILAEFYHPYRQAVEATIARTVASGGQQVLHISVHSFTPELNGEERTADIGLLYDPGRKSERAFCQRWQQSLRDASPELRVRKNYPYLGTADGFTTYLRTRFADKLYAGIELEVNQRYCQGPAKAWQELRKLLVASLGEIAHPIR